LNTPRCTCSGCRSKDTAAAQAFRSQYAVTLRSSAPADIEERSLRLTVETAAGNAEDEFNYRTLLTIAPTPVPPEPAPPIVIPTDSGSNTLPLLIFLTALGVVAAAVTDGTSW
jgi:hypothetical protein